MAAASEQVQLRFDVLVSNARNVLNSGGVDVSGPRAQRVTQRSDIFPLLALKCCSGMPSRPALSHVQLQHAALQFWLFIPPVRLLRRLT